MIGRGDGEAPRSVLRWLPVDGRSRQDTGSSSSEVTTNHGTARSVRARSGHGRPVSRSRPRGNRRSARWGRIVDRSTDDAEVSGSTPASPTPGDGESAGQHGCAGGGHVRSTRRGTASASGDPGLQVSYARPAKFLRRAPAAERSCVGAFGCPDDRSHRLTIQAGDLGELAERGAGSVCHPNHVIADAKFLSGPLCAQTDDRQCGSDLTILATPVLAERGDGSGDLCFAVTRCSSRRARVSLSRTAISRASRGEISCLASASSR